MKKILTLALAMAVVIGGIATNSVTVKACEWDPDCHGFCPHGPNDTTVWGDTPAGGYTWDDGDSSDNGGSDSGSYDEPSYSEPSYSEPTVSEPGSDAPANDAPANSAPASAPANDAPANSTPANSTPASDTPVYSYAPEDNGNSYNSGTFFDEPNAAADAAGTTGEAAGGLKRRGSFVTVPGFEEARHLFQKDKTWYAVLHKGQEVATIAVVAADGHEVTYNGVGMKQLEDGRWVINVVILGGDELTAEQLAGYTITTMKGDCANLPALGISGICINGTLVRDIDAEVAAAAA